MELPIYENAAPVGTLQIFPQGLYTVFEARLPALASPSGGGVCGVSRPPQTEGVAPSPVSLRTCQGTHKFYGSFVAKNL